MQASVRTTVAMALVALTVSTALSAGVVRTLDARLEGDVVFADGRIEVGNKSVPWDAVVYIMPDGRARTLGTPGAVRLVGGQVWRADILRLSAGRLTIRSRLWGRREIDAAGVTAIEFARGAPKADGAKPATLYREDGEPIPGSLLWIDPSRLAIDSPLGVLTLSRKGLLCYVFGPAAARPADAPAADEVGLVDGTVLRGRAKPAQGGVSLQHATLGTLTLGAKMIRYIRRHNAPAVDLAEVWTRSAPAAASASITSHGLTGRTPQGRPVEVIHAGDEQRGGATYLTAVRVRPKSVVRYRLPQAAGGSVKLTGRMGPVEGARGDVRIRIAAGDRVLLEKEFAPDAGEVALRLDVPAGSELVFDVDFGRRIGFPAGICLKDPLLIRR